MSQVRDAAGLDGGVSSILVVYFWAFPVVRATVLDHLYSFDRHSGIRCVYLNAGLRRVPAYIRNAHFDLVVFHFSLFAERFDADHFRRLTDRLAFLKAGSALKVALPQDEHFCADRIVTFVEQFDVRLVFSCGTARAWDLIYDGIDRGRVGFRTVLTGYLDGVILDRIERVTKRVGARDIDVGYRSWYPWPALGRLGRLKGEIGVRVRAAALARGLVTDVELGDVGNMASGGNANTATLVGDAWFEFLARCKWTVGAEGGASVLDRDGSVQRCTIEHLAANPGASFEDIERTCFPGRDGGLEYLAISPRHLEACATRTCQVLVEGEYSGVLTAGVHYIPVRRDFSNLEHAIDLASDESVRGRIADRAYTDVVLSGEWSYPQFVRTVLEEARIARIADGSTEAHTVPGLTVLRARWLDRRKWFYVRVEASIRRWIAASLGERRGAQLLSSLRRIVGPT